MRRPEQNPFEPRVAFAPAQFAPVPPRSGRAMKTAYRDSTCQASTILVLGSIIVAGVAAGQQPGSVGALLRIPAVGAALDAVRVSEPRTIEDQIRFCEVPAPPFKEAARAAVLKRAFEDLGLLNVH